MFKQLTSLLALGYCLASLHSASAATFAVTTLIDENDGAASGTGGSLREAITDANTLPGPHVITFAPSLFTGGAGTIPLTLGPLPMIMQELTVQGPGKTLLSVSGSTNTALSTSFITSVSLNALAIRNCSGSTGGAINSGGTLTVNDCEFSNCNSSGPNSGGAITAAFGLTLNRCSFMHCNGNGAGAVYTNGPSFAMTQCLVDDCLSLTDAGGINVSGFFLGIAGRIDSCTFSNNIATGSGGAASVFAGVPFTNCSFLNNIAFSNGGAINGGQMASFTNCTFSNNTADLNGGAIYIPFMTAFLNNCTLTQNRADMNADGNGDGGGIYAPPGASASLQNSVVAGNIVGTPSGTAPDIFGSVVGTGYNLVGDGAGSTGISNGVSGNQVGTSVSLLNPLLAGLADNGGGMLTHLPLPGSPLLEKGTDASLGSGAYGNPEKDQRGFSRVSGLFIDIGAVEAVNDPTLPAMVVDTLSDADNGTYTTGDLSLREAILFSNARAGAQSITFSPALTAAGSTSITLNSGALPTLTGEVQIVGPGANLLAISGMKSVRVLQVDASTTVAITGLTIRDGNAPGELGGGINNLGILTLSDCTITTNSSGGAGGVYVASTGLLNASRCTISQNFSEVDSGGIRLSHGTGTVNLSDCIISDNVATNFGGGIDMYPPGGPVVMSRCAVKNNVSGRDAAGMWINHPLVISESAVTGNEAGNDANGGGAVISSPTTMVNCTLDTNRAGGFGGALFLTNNPTTSTLTNVTVTGNHADTNNNNVGNGGGIHIASGLISIANSALALNSDDTTAGGSIYPDASGSFFSGGHNLIGDSTGATGFTNGAKSDIVGNTGSPVNPVLGALAYNGGTTLNRMPLTGSPLLNAGDIAQLTNPPFVSGLIDQRGLPRIAGASVDIGAIEFQPPPVSRPDLYTTDEDTTLVVASPGVLGNDSDISTASLITSTLHGTLQFSNNGGFTYAPAANFHGTDSFTYRAQNVLGQLSGVSSVTLTVTSVNDPPKITAPNGKGTSEDTPMTLPGISVSDVDAGSSSVQVTLHVSHGIINVGASGAATVTGDGTTTVQLSGSVAGINTRLAGLRYTPAANFNGSDSLSIHADDLGNSGAGGPQTADKAMFLGITPVSDSVLQVSKTADVVRGSAGTTVTYTIVTTVVGNEATSGPVVISDTPPDGLLLMGAQTSSGIVQLLPADVAPFYQVRDFAQQMSPGASETFTLVFFTTSTQTITNTATAYSGGFTASASVTTILCPALTAPPAGDCAAFPDLVVQWTTPPTFSKGKLKGKALVKNNSTHDALNVPVSFLLSADGCPSPDDTVLSPKVLKALKAGKSKKMNLSARLLASPSGKMVVFTVDPDNIVPECDETNNLAPAGPLP
jgi:predicted outer membrane repeat protein